MLTNQTIIVSPIKYRLTKINKQEFEKFKMAAENYKIPRILMKHGSDGFLKSLKFHDQFIE